MKEDEYIILSAEGHGDYREKGSKFLGYSYILDSTDALDDIISKLKKLHPKARHWCYAYRLSPNSDQHRANDDGEPRGTAGLTIYNQILAKNCFNVLVVVVRYFGGTKLGASGLIRAYKAGAEDALNNSTFKTVYDSISCLVQYDYKHSGTLMDIIKSLGIEIVNHEYGLKPQMTIQLRESKAEELIKKIKSIMLGRPIEDIKDDTIVDDMSFEF
jgi:uncharacterized YigZ family protein